MKPEEWRPVPGYEDIYSVSSEGRIVSLARIVMRPHGRTGKMTAFKWPEKTLKLTIRGGMPSVALCKEGALKQAFVAPIVLLAFVGSPPSLKHTAHHKDGDVTNNRLENLTWATHRERVKGLLKVGNFVGGADHPRFKHGERQKTLRAKGLKRERCPHCYRVTENLARHLKEKHAEK